MSMKKQYMSVCIKQFGRQKHKITLPSHTVTCYILMVIRICFYIVLGVYACHMGGDSFYGVVLTVTSDCFSPLSMSPVADIHSRFFIKPQTSFFFVFQYASHSCMGLPLKRLACCML